MDDGERDDDEVEDVEEDFDETASVSEALSDERRNVHLPRQKLRQTLLEALDPEAVVWGKKFDRYEERADGSGVTLHFDDGTTTEAGILVGADGIFSRVRAQKLGDEPLSYLGVIVILGICRGVDHALCRNKVFQVVDGENRMYAMPFTASADGDGCIPPLEGEAATEGTQPGAMMWQLSFPVTVEEAKSLASDPLRLREEAVRRCGSWPEPVGKLLAQTREDCMAGYPAYDRDMAPFKTLRGDPTSLVTLIGDAAHPMSPFKGQGANQALLDAVHLARCIARTPRYLLAGERRHGCVFPFETTHDALAEAERTMLQRAKAKVTKSRDAAKYLHSPAALTEGNCVRAHAAASACGDDSWM
jgi:2-polyprenyl-6-methoxyphenol hydroxylase-like FAD-dependent oxidoreductase